MSETATAFPLAWPAAKPRARSRRSSAFSHRGSAIDVDTARRRLRDELARIGAKDVILSTNIRLRVDGTPGVDQKAAAYDPGAALYFKHKGKDVVLAVDTFLKVAENIAALAAHIEATRAIERYGVGSLEQMFTGFTALPPATSVNDWREELQNPRDLAEAEENYRHLMLRHHPDVAGPSSTAKAAALNAAIALARKALA